MTVAFLAGLGEVGVRAARQLTETPGIDAVVIAATPSKRTEDVLASLGDRVRLVQWQPGADLPDGCDVAVAALPGELDRTVAEAAVARGVPAVVATDRGDVAEAIGELDGAARRAGVAVAVGAGMAPGLSCVLAAHAATLFDELIEIRVARCGIAGDASERSAREELRPMPLVRRAGKWVRGARLEELEWFPEPIGARDCQLVGAGGPLLARLFPEIERVTWSMAEPVKVRKGMRRVDPDDGWGAIRVEVFGRRGGAVDSVVYGVVDRTALAAGATLAVAAAHVVARDPAMSGVGSLAAFVDPVPFLHDLAARGVKAAAFEGAAPI